MINRQVIVRKLILRIKLNKDLIYRSGHWNKVLNAVNKQGTKAGVGQVAGKTGALPTAASGSSPAQSAGQPVGQSQGSNINFVLWTKTAATKSQHNGFLSRFQSKVNNIVRPGVTEKTHIYTDSSTIDIFRKEESSPKVLAPYTYSDPIRNEAHLIYEHFKAKGMEFSPAFQAHMGSPDSAFYKRFG